MLFLRGFNELWNGLIIAIQEFAWRHQRFISDWAALRQVSVLSPSCQAKYPLVYWSHYFNFLGYFSNSCNDLHAFFKVLNLWIHTHERTIIRTFPCPLKYFLSRWVCVESRHRTSLLVACIWLSPRASKLALSLVSDWLTWPASSTLIHSALVWLFLSHPARSARDHWLTVICTFSCKMSPYASRGAWTSLTRWVNGWILYSNGCKQYVSLSDRSKKLQKPLP